MVDLRFVVTCHMHNNPLDRSLVDGQYSFCHWLPVATTFRSVLNSLLILFLVLNHGHFKTRAVLGEEE